MCRGGVGSILVMFDVLYCYILYMCLLLFVYCIPVLEAPQPGNSGGCGTMWCTFIGQKEQKNVRVLGSSDPHGQRT
jgi:hypothetical protein